MSKIIGQVGNLAVANEVEGTVVTMVLEDGAALEIPIIAMTIKIKGEVKVKEEGSLQITEEEVKIISLMVDADNRMVMTWVTMTEIIGIEIMTVIIMEIEVGDGMVIEGKVIVIEDGEDNGIQVPNTHNRITHNTTQTKTITSPLLWDANINTNCPMSNTHPTHNSNSSIHSDHPHNRDKQLTYVSCVRTKATMTISANLQVILWPKHKRPLTKAVCIITKTPLKGNGRTGTMMTPMPNLFSKGGS